MVIAIPSMSHEKVMLIVSFKSPYSCPGTDTAVFNKKMIVMIANRTAILLQRSSRQAQTSPTAAAAAGAYNQRRPVHALRHSPVLI